MPPRWNRLQLPNKDVPPLLFQYTWTQQGYEFYVTDLTYIWSERLPKKQIIKRAEEDVTTIDPGEDPEQLNVLLEKIGEALQNGTDSVTLSSGTQADSLEVRTTTKLPAPLKPLKWNLILAKEEPCYLTSKMLLPLLREEANWEVRQRSLLQQIKQKDSVISKFLDKIETIGVDLGSVFPSAAGSRASRKGVTRSEAARFVKGLEPFEEQSWLAEAGSSDGAGLATNLLQELADPGESHDDSATDRQGWWCQLTRSPEEPPIHDKKNEQEAPQKHVDTEGESTASSDEDDGDFQVIHISFQPCVFYRLTPFSSDKKHLLALSRNQQKATAHHLNKSLERRVRHQRHFPLNQKMNPLRQIPTQSRNRAAAVFQLCLSRRNPRFQSPRRSPSARRVDWV